MKYQVFLEGPKSQWWPVTVHLLLVPRSSPPACSRLQPKESLSAASPNLWTTVFQFLPAISRAVSFVHTDCAGKPLSWPFVPELLDHVLLPGASAPKKPLCTCLQTHDHKFNQDDLLHLLGPYDPDRPHGWFNDLGKSFFSQVHPHLPRLCRFFLVFLEEVGCSPPLMNWMDDTGLLWIWYFSFPFISIHFSCSKIPWQHLCFPWLSAASLPASKFVSIPLFWCWKSVVHSSEHCVSCIHQSRKQMRKGSPL